MIRQTFAAFAVAGTVIICGGVLMSQVRPGSQPTAYISDSRMTSTFVPQDFALDGSLAKPVWRGATWVHMDHDAFSKDSYPQSTTLVASLWSTRYVYFAFRCRYTDLNVYEGGDGSKDFWKLWERDVVEVFLNPQPERMNHYYEFEVAPNNLWIDLAIDLDQQLSNDPKWDSGFEHATHLDKTKHAWACEMRIPVASMQVTKPIEAGAEWRVNFFRADGPGGEGQRRLLSWSPVQSDKHSFHSPWSFGIIQFVK